MDCIKNPEVFKLPSVKVTEDDFNGVINLDADHYIFIDNVVAKLLSEHGFNSVLQEGWNNISMRKAEQLIPVLRSAILGLKRKKDIKKFDGFIDMLIWSYTPEFKDKWLNDKTICLRCDSKIFN